MASASPDFHASSSSTLSKDKKDTFDNASVSIHKRTYQACIPCRRRKVRCDLGPVDNPHEPPCVRCRRESKECYFSATRRKRKGEDDDNAAVVDNDYVVRNHRRKISHNQDPPETSQPRKWHSQTSAASGSPSSASPAGVHGWNDQEGPNQPSAYARETGQDAAGTSGDQEVTNETAAALFQSPINNPGDALHLLLEASGRTGDLHRQASVKEENGRLDPSRDLAIGVSHASRRLQKPNFTRSSEDRDYISNIDPSITNHTAAEDEPGSVVSLYRKALRTWSSLRFVRAGWFTAVEAMSYIDYFYEYLEPMTPISPPDFRSLDKSPDLLRDEAMLTVTILTIASRYKSLPGPGGRSRSFVIHDRLWEYLQQMISRMFFSQEQFGGGFCDASQKPGDQGRLRTLGSIESLLLLSEFHPRAMHFPPGDGEETLVPMDTDNDSLSKTDGDASKPGLSGQSTLTSWTEPALRSDRLCWSLIGFAQSLAYELGLFGSFAETYPVDVERSQCLQRILYIYLSQTSGRLGLSSMFHGVSGEDSFASLRAFLFDDNNTSRAFAPGEAILACWTDVTRIMRVSNLRLFPSQSQTMHSIRSGEYIGLLQEFQPILHSWWEKFERYPLSKYPKIILTIEFEYARVYINSLALQAVLEQWTSNASQSHSQSLSDLYTTNEIYIKEVVSSSRNLLRQVVDGLLPGNYLKHVPVRTFFRILSGAMFLLKSFALGAKENEVMTSLLLLDRTIKALRTSVVDDVHLCLRTAELLEGLTTSVRNKFVRLAGQTAGRTTEQGNSPLPVISGPLRPLSRMNQTMQEDAGIPNNDPNNYSKSISIMPPPNDAYNLDSNYTFSPANQLSPLINQHQQLYPTADGMSGLPGTADDWLTLDLNPLLDSSSFGGMDNPWFGNFGPEINGNLDVLGKLVNEGFGGDMGF